MSLPSDVRRNPSRSTCIPRRPDSPVSYALPPSTERNQSLSESDHGPNSETVNNTGIDPDQTNIHADLVNDAPAGIEAASLNEAAECRLCPGDLIDLLIEPRAAAASAIDMLRALRRVLGWGMRAGMDLTAALVQKYMLWCGLFNTSTRLVLSLVYIPGILLYCPCTRFIQEINQISRTNQHLNNKEQRETVQCLANTTASVGPTPIKCHEATAMAFVRCEMLSTLAEFTPIMVVRIPLYIHWRLGLIVFIGVTGENMVHGALLSDGDDDSDGASLPDLDSMDSSEGSYQQRADELVAQISRLQGHYALPVEHAQPSVGGQAPVESKALVSVSFTALQGQWTQMLLQDFVDVAAQDGTIFLRLQAAGGLDYTNHQYNFREIGSLLDLENSHSRENIFEPIPASPARSALLETQRVAASTPVFVLYVYHQDAEPYSDRLRYQSTAGTTLLLQSPVTVRFSVQYADLATWRARTYGSTYIHCLTEHQILGHTHRPAIIGSMTICLEDVVSAAGINFTTFSTMRTEFHMVKEAHVILRRLARAGTLPGVYRPLLDFVEAMMSDEAMSEVEFTVVR
ncbi:hypothetical protein B0H10DRAFT_1969778 [Mycena sp. CBHHK59/15]|nr:hypothetical protein B0H10DRAFT_1969778 [Mycena sp. CBHHK59/15]